jgi:hypothetical protein
MWRSRAFMFAKKLSDPERQNKWYSGATMMKYPYNLMEGLSGDISLISELLLNQTTRLPGFELL